MLFGFFYSLNAAVQPERVLRAIGCHRLFADVAPTAMMPAAMTSWKSLMRAAVFRWSVT